MFGLAGKKFLNQAEHSSWVTLLNRSFIILSVKIINELPYFLIMLEDGKRYITQGIGEEVLSQAKNLMRYGVMPVKTSIQQGIVLGKTEKENRFYYYLGA